MLHAVATSHCDPGLNTRYELTRLELGHDAGYSPSSQRWCAFLDRFERHRVPATSLDLHESAQNSERVACEKGSSGYCAGVRCEQAKFCLQ